MKSKPSFSIVIPTYQRRDVVSDAVRALGNLRYAGKVEIIVAVDGSNDGTPQALAEVKSPHSLKVIELDHGGAARARNRGAAKATGDIILFLDDDMIAAPNLIDEHAKMHRAGAEAVIGDVRHDTASPQSFLADAIALWIEAARRPEAITPFDIFTGQMSVRRTVFEELGGFDESFTSDGRFANEDADFGARLLERYQVRHNPSAITNQRYVVSPRENMRRASRAAAADLHFIAKHPRYQRELLELRGASSPITRFVYRPVSRVPFIPRLLECLAVRLGERSLNTRHRSNRALRYFFGAARRIAYWKAINANGGVPKSNGLLVLCYHAIRDQSSDPVLAPYGVPREQFVSQLKSLSRRGYTFVSPAAVAAFVNEGTPLPRKSILLTFDDCYQDLLDVAKAELRPRGIEAIAFAVTGSDTNDWDQHFGAGRLNLLTHGELSELNALGVEIGAHSRTHREMPLLNDKERVDEAAGSADDLVSSGLSRPRFFAYPYGAADKASIAAVRKSGYLAGFGLASRIAKKSSNPFNLPRVMVGAADAGFRFQLKTSFPSAYATIQNNIRRARKVLARAAPSSLA